MRFFRENYGNCTAAPATPKTLQTNIKPTTSAVVGQCPPSEPLTEGTQNEPRLPNTTSAGNRSAAITPIRHLPDLYTKSCLLLQHQGLSQAPTSTAQASQSTDWVFGSWKRGESGLASITSFPLVPSRNRALRSTLYDKKNSPNSPRSPMTISDYDRSGNEEERLRVVSAALAEHHADAEHAADEEEHEGEAGDDHVEVALLERIAVLHPDRPLPGDQLEVFGFCQLHNHRNHHENERRHRGNHCSN